LIDYEEAKSADGTRVFAGKISVDGNVQSVSGRGNGLISSVVATLARGSASTSTSATIPNTP
jgi:2-isopropylmalate synthase